MKTQARKSSNVSMLRQWKKEVRNQGNPPLIDFLYGTEYVSLIPDTVGWFIQLRDIRHPTPLPLKIDQKEGHYV
jgi:hypothetical protein